MDDPSEGAILYVCDDSRSLLKITATVRCEDADINPGDFAYHYEEKALATKVRRERAPYLSSDPRKDSSVHRTFEKFKIHGPIMGIPLLYGKDVAGVLVFWKLRGESASGTTARQQLETRCSRLQSIAPLLGVSIRKLQADYQKDVMFKWLYRILFGVQLGNSLVSKMQYVLDALMANGFDRVRVFTWDQKRSKFIGWLSSGMTSPQLFRGLEIDPKFNPFAREIEAAAFTDPVARKYDPIFHTDSRFSPPGEG